tara:strand:+ start:1785 stop:2030 length:246 start_codon:yes stop_codon:yes gene_type:complete
MLSSNSFKKEKMKNTINIKALKNVACNGQRLKKGKIYEVPVKDGNLLISFKDAEICESKPKAKKTAKKKTAKSEPVIDAQR